MFWFQSKQAHLVIFFFVDLEHECQQLLWEKERFNLKTLLKYTKIARSC